MQRLLFSAALGAFILPLAACSDSGLDQSSYTLIEVIDSGGSVTVSGSKFSSYTLVDMAKAAEKSGAVLTIVDAGGLSSYTMVDIAKAAPGKVRFED